MEEENNYIDEIGTLAKFIDNEMSILERMKIGKSSIIKIVFALMFYVIIMLFLTTFL